jgi:hypothetical protein
MATTANQWRNERLYDDDGLKLTVIERAVLDQSAAELNHNSTPDSVITMSDIIAWRLANNLHTFGDMADYLERIKSKVQSPGPQGESGL